MFKKEKRQPKEETDKQKQEEKKPAQQQILTRSRVREFNKDKKRNTWLNKAIILVAILLIIMIYAILNY